MPSGVYKRKPLKVYENLPFSIHRYHKALTKHEWKKKGIIFDEIGHTFDEIYETYIYTTNCSYCNKKFENTRDRRIEHNHNITDAFNVRGVVCAGCNNNTKDVKIRKTNTSGEKYICFDKNRNRWKVNIHRTDHKFMKRCETKEEAVIERDKYINSQPNFYSI